MSARLGAATRSNDIVSATGMALRRPKDVTQYLLRTSADYPGGSCAGISGALDMKWRRAWQDGIAI